MDDSHREKLPFTEFLKTIKWLVVFNFKLSPWGVVFQILTRIAMDVSPLFTAYLVAKILDRAIKIAGDVNGDMKDVIPLLIVLLAFNLILSAFQSVYSYVSEIMLLRCYYGTPMILAEHIDSLGIQTSENPEVSNKIQRTKNLLGGINNDFERAVVFFARCVVLCVTSVIVIRTMPIVAGVIFISMIPEFISNRFHMRKSWRLWRATTEDLRKAFSTSDSLNETARLQEIKIISAFGYLQNIFTSITGGYFKKITRNSRNWKLYGFSLSLTSEIASIFGYFSILKNLFNKVISVGDVTFQIRTLNIFMDNLGGTMNGYGSLYERCIKVSEVKDFFEMRSMLSDGTVEMPQTEKPPYILFDDISFKYPNTDRYVLKNLNLHIRPGEKIAIVGENGAGKTTLVKLLARFYETTNGCVLLDGENINDLKIESWYKNLGVLFQDYNTYPYLTLKENISLGRADAPIDMTKVEQAAHQANVDSFVKHYKNGYEQLLGEKFKGGTRPSTGQWQKIAIARFFYRNSPVIVFDEPTASIDAVSEAEIFGKIYDFFEGKTVIIISHRFSTVRNADKIYVLDGGEIVESGSHEELMELNGKYCKAFTIQAKGYV
jgi:ATP-binding cassette subfamily B protein